MSSGFSQTSEEPKLHELRENFKKDYLSPGAVFQLVTDIQQERVLSGNNGFSVANMRFNLAGELDKGFGYFFLTNFATSPTILDAKMYLRVSSSVTLSAGLFKAPFSKEFLVPAQNIDFVNRSRTAFERILSGLF